MRFNKLKSAGLSWVAVISLSACGPDPSYKTLEYPTNGSGGAVDETGGVSTDGSSSIPSTGDANPNNSGENGSGNIAQNQSGGGSSNSQNGGSANNSGGSSNGGGSNNGGGNQGNNGIVFPDINNDSDKEELKKCLAAWGSTPFAGPTSVRKIYASVVIGGIGYGINDTARTAQPELVIVYAGVNVGGEVTYNMLNPNAYYCMVSNVNVNTQLKVNLHCNARLADSKIAIDIGSNGNSNTAAIGVNVGSNVTVQNIRPNGEACLR